MRDFNQSITITLKSFDQIENMQIPILHYSFFYTTVRSEREEKIVVA